MGTQNNTVYSENTNSLYMKSIKIESYEIKSSRNNLKVPVVNDVHLHSMYNPAKEAQAIVSKHDSALQSKNHVLVLGLGFAYHVYEVCRKLESYHGNDYKVIVIEPNEQVYRDCVANHLFPNKNIEVYSGENLQAIYSELNLVKFLIEKPLVISHPASFGLYQSFFKSFLEFDAEKDLGAITKFVTNRELKSYLYSDTESQDLDNFIHNNVLNKASFNNKLDHMLLAFTHLGNGEF
jgi:hypothetical protein